MPCGKGEHCMNQIDQAEQLLLMASKDMKAMDLMM